MDGTLQIGLKESCRVTVDGKNTAAAMESGDLPVFATPAMVALMEKTAAESVGPHLAPGQTSVGTMVQIEHVSATPMGGEVRCESELVDIEGRKLRFALAVYDDAGIIGRGLHERFIVEREKFMQRVAAKTGR